MDIDDLLSHNSNSKYILIHFKFCSKQTTLLELGKTESLYNITILLDKLLLLWKSNQMHTQYNTHHKFVKAHNTIHSHINIIIDHNIESTQ